MGPRLWHVRAGVAVLVLLHVPACLLWPGSLWGLSHLAVWPAAVALAWTGLALAALLVVRWPPPLRSPRTAPPREDTSPAADRWKALAAALIAAAVFWVVRERTHFFGDGYLLIRSRGYSSTVLRAPVLVQAIVWVVRGLETQARLAMENALAAVSVVSGAISVYLALRLAAGLAPSREGRRLVAALFLTAGAVQLFCGHVEYYAALVPAVLAYLLLARAGLEGGAPLWPTWLAFGALLTLHLSSLGLAGGQLYLGLVAWRRGERGRTCVAALAGIALAAALTQVAGSAAGALAEESVQGLGAYLGPYFDRTSLRHVFGFFSPAHALAVADDLALASPLALALLPAVWLARGVGGDPVRRHLGWAALGCLLLNVLFNREVGPYRDWDILAPYAFVSLAWVGTCLARSPGFVTPGRAHAAAALVLVGGLHHLLPWVVLNATPGAPLRHVQLVLRGESMWSPYARGCLHEEIAIFHRGQGDLRGALAEYEAASHASPSDARYRLGVGDMCLTLGDTLRAQAEYTEALRVRPSYAPAHNNLAAVLSLRGTDPEAARAHAATAVRLAPESFDCWITYAYVLRRLNDYPAARDAYQRAAALRPTSPTPQQGLQDLDLLERSR